MWVLILVIIFLTITIIVIYTVPVRDISPQPPIPPPVPPPVPPPPVVIAPIIAYNNFWLFTFTNDNPEPKIVYIEIKGIGGGLAFEHAFIVDVSAEFDFSTYLDVNTQYNMYANFEDSDTTVFPFTTPVPVVIAPIIAYNNFWLFTFTNDNPEPKIVYIQIEGIGGGVAFEHAFIVDVSAEYDFLTHLPLNTQYNMYANFEDSDTTVFPFTTPE